MEIDMPFALVDTNILLYVFDPRDEMRQNQAIALLDRLEVSSAGCLSAQCLAEFMNVASKEHFSYIKPREAVQYARYWAQVFPVFDLTPMVVLEAARGVQDHQLSYYDAQIWAAARLNQAPLVFSEDFQDGAVLEGVRFVNPFSTDFDLTRWV
jgi:predicted nucleic acid-binding protein